MNIKEIIFWGLGIGPIPNPQSPKNKLFYHLFFKYKNINKLNNCNYINIK